MAGISSLLRAEPGRDAGATPGNTAPGRCPAAAGLPDLGRRCAWGLGRKDSICEPPAHTRA
eukprot:7391843-Prymnesium_polylepis.2